MFLGVHKGNGTKFPRKLTHMRAYPPTWKPVAIAKFLGVRVSCINQTIDGCTSPLSSEREIYSHSCLDATNTIHYTLEDSPFTKSTLVNCYRSSNTIFSMLLVYLIFYESIFRINPFSKLILRTDLPFQKLTSDKPARHHVSWVVSRRQRVVCWPRVVSF